MSGARHTRRALVALYAVLAGCHLAGDAGDATAPASYGGAADIVYAETLWRDLTARRLVGDAALRTGEFSGRGPHGRRLQRVDGLLKIGGAIVPTLILTDSASTAAVVMTRRPDYRRRGDRDDLGVRWFWASFAADGSLRETADGRALAGRIDARAGRFDCIGCHRAAPGGDGVFGHDRYR